MVTETERTCGGALVLRSADSVTVDHLSFVNITVNASMNAAPLFVWSDNGSAHISNVEFESTRLEATSRRIITQRGRSNSKRSGCVWLVSFFQSLPPHQQSLVVISTFGVSMWWRAKSDTVASERRDRLHTALGVLFDGYTARCSFAESLVGLCLLEQCFLETLKIANVHLRRCC